MEWDKLLEAIRKDGLKVLIVILAILALLVAFSVIRSCERRDANQRVEAQADQGNRSADAIADAAQDAVETVSKAATTEAAINEATAEAMENIDHAENPDDVRRAVVDALCMRDAYRNDPACAVR